MPIGDMIGGVASVLGGKSPGVRQSIRTSAQGTLKGYADTSPLSLALNQQYQPSYLSLGGQNLQQILFGSPEQEYSQDVEWGGAKGKPTQRTTLTGTIPGSVGLFDTLGQAQQRYQGLQQQGADSYRQSELDQMAKYLPQAQALYAQGAPEMAALRSQIGADASQQLALGDLADPETVARWRNQNTAQYANMGFRPNNDFVQADSLLKYYGQSNQLQNQRQNYALNALGQLNQTQPDYASYIGGMRDPSLSAASNLLGAQQGLSYQGNQYDPYNSAAAGVGVAGARNQIYTADQVNQGYGAIGQGAVDIGAAAFGGGLF